jgi:hypothetical protein
MKHLESSNSIATAAEPRVDPQANIVLAVLRGARNSKSDGGGRLVLLQFVSW